MKKISIYISFIFLVLVTVLVGRAYGQTTVQVVTKSIAGEEEWAPGMSLEINGENAEIHCEAHTTNTIIYEIHLVAKHANKKQAERDLEKQKWVKGKQGKKLLMRNYIELARDDQRPESNLKAIYHIKIPEACQVDINNYFGKIIVKNTIGELNIDSEFTNITLINTRGTINIDSRLGDISGEAVGGRVEIISNRSNVYLIGISGSLTLDAVVAKVKLDKIGEITAINIEAEKSEVSLTAGNQYRFLLDLQNVDFEKPEWISEEASAKEKDLMKINFEMLSDSPLINIKLSIGTLNLK